MTLTPSEIAALQALKTSFAFGRTHDALVRLMEAHDAAEARADRLAKLMIKVREEIDDGELSCHLSRRLGAEVRAALAQEPADGK